MSLSAIIIGGSGFVGSHAVERLLSTGYKVLNVDRRIPKYASAAEFIEGDIRDLHTLNKIIEYNPDYIVHLAAMSRVEDGVKNPYETVDTNVHGTLRLLETARNIPRLKRFLYISSEQVYGRAETIPIREEECLQPYNTYGASKAAADILSRTYSEWMPITILRSAMGYGPRSPPNQVVTKFFLKALSCQPLIFDPIVQKDPSLSPTRDCNYISNFIDAILLVLQKEKAIGEIYNIGSGEEISILELAKKIIKITDSRIEFSSSYRERPAEVGTRFLLDFSKARVELGYTPLVCLDDGLRRTYEWIVANDNYFDE